MHCSHGDPILLSLQPRNSPVELREFLHMLEGLIGARRRDISRNNESIRPKMLGSESVSTSPQTRDTWSAS
jgi:hypothetical protein